MTEQNLKDLEVRIGYSFKSMEMLFRALTHKSYANEVKNNIEHNEKYLNHIFAF